MGRTSICLLRRRKPFDLKALVCLVTFVLAAALVITPVQSQTGQLIPDWTSVTQDFFNMVPGAANPVLTAASVTDRTANYVADPFIFHEGNTWYMFFEVASGVNTPQETTEIGLATSSNGFDWTYQRIVLSESFRYLAYPYVLKWEGTYYLIPETYGMNQVRLYKATNFPYSWTFVNVLISGQDFGFIPVDSSIFRYNNMWWMFTGDDNNMYLFYSDDLTNPASWHEHPISPIITNDPSKVRGGGRAIVFDSNRIIRLTQKGDVSYGEAVRAFEVDTLTETSYAEHEVPGSPLVAASGGGWNAYAMHNVDPWWTGNSWLAVVDGGGDYWWSIGIYVSAVTLLQATISPTSARMYVGQSQTFTSSVSGGTTPYSYQWYLNGTAQSGATASTWTFKPTQTGHYNVYLRVTDSQNNNAQSNTVTDILVYNQLTASINPTSANITLGQSQQFNSAVTGGVAPYTYQWYSNNTAAPGATNPTWTFTPTQTGHYNIYLNITDSQNNKNQSNTATLLVSSQLSATISPAHVMLYYGQSQTFSASVSGGVAPYTYQWVLNGTAVSGATNPTWTFTPKANGNYNVYVNVTDGQNNRAQSNTITDINVYSVNLLLTAGSIQTTFIKHQPTTFTVSVFNQLNPGLQPITLTLTVTGPGGYYFHDFQPISVAANAVGEYSFEWVAPNVTGAYVVETNLTPSLLTAYDSVWLTLG